MNKKRAHAVNLKKPQCYCNSGIGFKLCCEPALSGNEPAKTAEMLMRSRYTAFCLLDQNYLLQTWHLSTRPKEVSFEAQQQWLGLKILATHFGKQEDTQGQVEFIARYKIHGRAYRIHENSDFLWQDGHWYYTQGTLFGK